MNKLFNIYKEWRETTEELINEGNAGSVDCGEKTVREDFSNYAELEEEISFEKMLELEREYDKKY